MLARIAAALMTRNDAGWCSELLLDPRNPFLGFCVGGGGSAAALRQCSSQIDRGLSISGVKGSSGVVSVELGVHQGGLAPPTMGWRGGGAGHQ